MLFVAFAQVYTYEAKSKNMYWQIKGLVLFPITAFADVRTFYYDFFAGFISC